MTSIILAGGKSLRLGQNKALQVIQGKSLIQWVADRLTTFSREIIIVTAHGEAIPCSSTVRIRTVADIHPGKGSLVGIYSGLVASSSARAIVVGCDMPFLSIGLLDYMTQVSSTFDIVIPRIRDKLEPLCALYSKICLAPIKELLEQNELKISRLLSTVKVKYVGKEDVDTFDPEHLSFFNVNSRDDLEKARALAAQKTGLLH
jgi:molybdopterin-guanine dinucleotide biosynthesis protein A